MGWVLKLSWAGDHLALTSARSALRVEVHCKVQDGIVEIKNFLTIIQRVPDEDNSIIYVLSLKIINTLDIQLITLISTVLRFHL